MKLLFELNPSRPRKIPELTSSDIERFWIFVARKSDNECWVWLGHKNSDGFCLNDKMENAHRVSWAIHYGDPGNKLVLHNDKTCTRKDCTNPKHLSLGNQTENMRSAVDTGKKVSSKGSNHGSSKLVEADIPIRAAAGENRIDIARDYDVHKDTISDIVRVGNTLNNITGGYENSYRE
jgi:hypothetical protein